jgi:hypothetical protein
MSIPPVRPSHAQGVAPAERTTLSSFFGAMVDGVSALIFGQPASAASGAPLNSTHQVDAAPVLHEQEAAVALPIAQLVAETLPAQFSVAPAVFEAPKPGSLAYNTLLAVVQQNPKALKHNKWAQNDEGIVRAAFLKDPSSLEFASDAIKNNRGFMLELIKLDFRAFKYIGNELCGDKEVQEDFELDVIKQDPQKLQFFSNKWSGEEYYNFCGNYGDVLKRAVSRNGLALQYVPARWQDDLGIKAAAVTENPMALQFVNLRPGSYTSWSYIFKSMAEAIMLWPEGHRFMQHVISNGMFPAIYDDPWLLALYDKDHITPELALNVGKKDPRLLPLIKYLFTPQPVPEDFDLYRVHPELALLLPAEEVTPQIHGIIRELMEQKPELFRFVSPELMQADMHYDQLERITLVAIRARPETLELIDPRGMIDDLMIAVAIERHRQSNLLEGVLSRLILSRQITSDAAFPIAQHLNYRREVVHCAVKYYGVTPEDINIDQYRLDDDREIMSEAIDKDPSQIKQASPRLRGDREMGLVAVKKAGWVIRYLSDSLKADPEIFHAANLQNPNAWKEALESFEGNPTPEFSALLKEYGYYSW